MCAISFDKDTIIEYVPDYDNNRKRKSMRRAFKFVPFRGRFTRGFRKGKNMNDLAKVTEAGQEIQKKQFVENVEGVSGYFIGEKEVTDASEFYATADTNLITEIIRAMESQSKLSEGQRKNS